MASAARLPSISPFLWLFLHVFLIGCSCLRFSFHDAIRDEEEISGSLPRLLLANKSDLVMQRQVQPETVKAAAQRFGCKYLETSARNGVGIDQAFETLIRCACLFSSLVFGMEFYMVC